MLVLCVPHQFIRATLKRMMGRTKPGAVAVSLVKGMRVTAEGPQLISQMVTKYLGIDCSVLMVRARFAACLFSAHRFAFVLLSLCFVLRRFFFARRSLAHDNNRPNRNEQKPSQGPNIARDVGEGELTEAVLGYQQPENARLLRQLFETPSFLVTPTPDAAGAEVCGTLKNIVALAAGFVDGAGMGVNAKATVMRRGLDEMRRLAKALYPTVRDETFFLPCGVADLVATCFGGRNRKVAEAFARAQGDGRPRTFGELEAELLGGQKLQGVLTTIEVRSRERERPLFCFVLFCFVLFCFVLFCFVLLWGVGASERPAPPQFPSLGAAVHTPASCPPLKTKTIAHQP